jgi:1-deoxy-D-xylulose-5-phosphate synthase
LRHGADVALVGLGKSVGVALEAAELLAGRGVDASVVDARFAKPLDVELLAAWARRCGRLVTVEDHARHAGLGGAVLEALSDAGLALPVLRLGLPDRFIEHAEVDAQWREAGIDAAAVADSVLRHFDAEADAAPRRARGARG